MRVLESKPFAFGTLKLSLVLVRSNSCFAVDSVSEIDFVIKDSGDCPIIPSVDIFGISDATVTADLSITINGRLENLLLA